MLEPHPDMRLAIVGSIRFAFDEQAERWAKEYIRTRLDQLNPEQVISGGAGGIDTFAANIAMEKGIYVTVFLPLNKRWEPEGYKVRNILIAENCTDLIRIVHVDSRTYGSGWTANYAERIGKNVERITYNPNV